MNRLIFILEMMGITVLVTAFVASLGVIFARQYGISEAPSLVLSTINIVAVIALAIFTYSYMKSTALMAREMKATRDLEFELHNKPKVIVRFDPRSSGAIHLVVENAGNGAARNVKLSITPELRNYEGLSANDLTAFKHGISYFLAKEKLEFFLNVSHKIYGDNSFPKEFMANLEYDWSIEGKPRIVETYPISLLPYRGTLLTASKDLRTLIEEVEKIRHALEKRP